MVATYTIQIKTIAEACNHTNDRSHQKTIDEARKYLFDFDYPFYEERERENFERDFIRYFYMREIGQETEELFKFNLETWLLINMPYYNQLFKSQLIDFDPLINQHTETSRQTDRDKQEDETNKTNTQQQTDTSSSGDTNSDDDSFTRNIEENTPDSRLQLSAGNGTMIQYASNINEEDSRSESHNTETSQSNTETQGDTDTTRNQTDDEQENMRQTYKGKSGDMTYAEMLQAYRSTFMRIEKMIFNDLENLFMLVY